MLLLAIQPVEVGRAVDAADPQVIKQEWFAVGGIRHVSQNRDGGFPFGMMGIERRRSYPLKQALIFARNPLRNVLRIVEFVGSDQAVDAHAVAKRPELRQQPECVVLDRASGLDLERDLALEECCLISQLCGDFFVFLGRIQH